MPISPILATIGARRNPIPPPPPEPTPSPFWTSPNMMSQSGYEQSLSSGDLGEPGSGGLADFLRDWASRPQEGRGITGIEGVPASYENVLLDLQRRGLDTSQFAAHPHDPSLMRDVEGIDVANPFAALFQKYQDLASGTVDKQKQQFENLQQQLAANAAQYQQQAAGSRAGIQNAYRDAGSANAGVANDLRSRLTDEAKAMGIQQALRGSATQEADVNAGRIQAMNAGSQAASLANFDTLNQVYNNLLGTRKDIASTLQSSMANSALESGRNRYGLSDPNALYAELIGQTNQGRLAGKQSDIDLANLQLQLAQQQATMAAASGGGGGSSGGGGGGGGRRSSGRRSSGGGGGNSSTGGSQDLGAQSTPYEVIAQAFAQNPTVEGGATADALARQLYDPSILAAQRARERSGGVRGPRIAV